MGPLRYVFAAGLFSGTYTTVTTRSPLARKPMAEFEAVHGVVTEQVGHSGEKIIRNRDLEKGTSPPELGVGSHQLMQVAPNTLYSASKISPRSGEDVQPIIDHQVADRSGHISRRAVTEDDSAAGAPLTTAANPPSIPMSPPLGVQTGSISKFGDLAPSPEDANDDDFGKATHNAYSRGETEAHISDSSFDSVLPVSEGAIGSSVGPIDGEKGYRFAPLPESISDAQFVNAVQNAYSHGTAGDLYNEKTKNAVNTVGNSDRFPASGDGDVPSDSSPPQPPIHRSFAQETPPAPQPEPQLPSMETDIDSSTSRLVPEPALPKVASAPCAKSLQESPITSASKPEPIETEPNILTDVDSSTSHLVPPVLPAVSTTFFTQTPISVGIPEVRTVVAAAVPQQNVVNIQRTQNIQNIEKNIPMNIPHIVDNPVPASTMMDTTGPVPLPVPVEDFKANLPPWTPPEVVTFTEGSASRLIDLDRPNEISAQNAKSADNSMTKSQISNGQAESFKAPHPEQILQPHDSENGLGPKPATLKPPALQPKGLVMNPMTTFPKLSRGDGIVYEFDWREGTQPSPYPNTESTQNEDEAALNHFRERRESNTTVNDLGRINQTASMGVWAQIGGQGKSLFNQVLEKNIQNFEKVLGGPILSPQLGDPDIRYFTQPWDHDVKSDSRTWAQRYQIVTDYYKPGGPAFLFVGGEGPITPEVLTQPNLMMITKWAKQFGAVIFQLEHRFYGESQIQGGDPLLVAHLPYLTSTQALVDASQFMKWVSGEPNLYNGGRSGMIDYYGAKWIAFGGSYPGNLAAWLRMLYPDLVWGAIASSAPLHAQAKFPEYAQTCARNLRLESYGDKCWSSVETAMRGLQGKAKTQEGIREIISALKICPQDEMYFSPRNWSDAYYPLVVSPYGSIDYGLAAIQSALFLAFQTNTQYGNRQRPNFHDYCSIWLNSTLSVYAKIENTLKKAYPTRELDLNPYLYPEEAQNSPACWVISPHISAAQMSFQPDPWLWQTCNEFGYQMTLEQFSVQPWGERAGIHYVTAQYCQGFFRALEGHNAVEDQALLFQNPSAYVAKKVEETNTRFNGRNLKPSRVVFVNGDYDPWSPLSVLPGQEDASLEQYSFVVPGGAHCDDMMQFPASYPEPFRSAVVSVQNNVTAILQKWIAILPPREIPPNGTDGDTVVKEAVSSAHGLHLHTWSVCLVLVGVFSLAVYVLL